MRRRGSLCVCVLLPILVHLAVLSPWLSADPILWWSGLAFDAPGHDLLVPGNPGWADGNAGVTTEALGHLAASEWLRGKVPWWNPYGGIGLPLAAEMQNSALFLPFVLLLHFHDGVLLLKIAMQILTGLASFALFRTLRIVPGVACLCAVLAEFNGTFAWYAHGPIMPVAFLPILLLGIERCRLAVLDGCLGGQTLIAVAIAYSIYAGFPETAFLDGLFSLVFALARLVIFPDWMTRRRFVWRVGVGGLCGLLLSAPATISFLDFLRHAYLSAHADYSFATQLPGNLAMMVLPSVFGPPLFNFSATGQGLELWWKIGGYVSLPLVMLALWSLLEGHGRERALRLAVGFWLFASFLKSAGVSAVAFVWDLVPGVRDILLPVYITPSWEFAAILLAALALDDWVRRSEVTRARLVQAALAASLLLVIIALGRAWPDIVSLVRHAPHYLLITALPVSITLVVSVAAAIVVASRATSCRFTVLSCLLGFEALVNFTVPLLSAATARPLDNGPVEFLRTHLGLQRFYSVSAFQPNYGAYERLAQVNHNYLPVPQDWVDFVHARLGPSMDGVQFYNYRLRPNERDEAIDPAVTPDVPTKNTTNVLASLGVKYLVAPHGGDPFLDVARTPVFLRDKRPLPLPPDQSLSVSLHKPETFVDGDITRVAVDVGTYRGGSDGALAVTVCSGRVCRKSNSRLLKGAVDNALLWFDLDQPLSVVPQVSLTATFTHTGGKFSVAIYLWPALMEGGVTIGSDHLSSAERLPLLAFTFKPHDLAPPRVYADRLIDIFSVPNAAPYENAALGHCRLNVTDRDSLYADCKAPDLLVRRELFFPGWRVNLNGHPATLGRDGLFQTVDLPSGRVSIRFFYRPAFIRLASAAMVLGVLGLFAERLARLGRRRLSCMQ